MVFPFYKMQDDIDWSKGGIYTPEEVDDMQTYLEFSRTRDAIGFKLAEQTINFDADGALTIQSAFPETTIPHSWKEALFGRFLHFCHQWGETASILISLYILWRIISYFLSFIYRLIILKDVHGWSKELCWAPCADLFLMRNYHTNHRYEPPTVHYRTGNTPTEEDTMTEIFPSLGSIIKSNPEDRNVQGQCEDTLLFPRGKSEA